MKSESYPFEHPRIAEVGIGLFFAVVAAGAAVIVKRGIKMSGMPAWEATHSGEELWALVAFLKVLPTMPSAEYQGAVEYYATNVAGKAMEMQESHH